MQALWLTTAELELELEMLFKAELNGAGALGGTCYTYSNKLQVQRD